MGRTSLQVELLPSAALATDRNGPPSVLCARCGLALFDCKALGYNHKQSRRFLDKDYPLFRDDVCLRSWVEKLSQGTPMADLQGPFTRWLARFAASRVSERSVEGIHSLVTKIYRRAPAASLPYVSSELRLGDIVKCSYAPSESLLVGTFFL